MTRRVHLRASYSKHHLFAAKDFHTLTCSMVAHPSECTFSSSLIPTKPAAEFRFRMASMEPEAYTFTSTDFAPNNKLPVLVYRNILKQPVDEQSVTEQLTKHNWRKLGAWGHIPKPHFHPNTHECYGVFAGTSTLRLGAASFNDAKDGEEKKNHLISVGPGDVIILPAGTCHSCVESKDGYRYVGVYPEVSPDTPACCCGAADLCNCRVVRFPILLSH